MQKKNRMTDCKVSFIVLEKPQIENQEVVDKIDSVAGGNITLVGKTSGNPKPNTTWLHNGRRVKRHAQVEENNNSVALTLDNVVKEDEGDYTLLAYNSAGIVEKKFNLRILGIPSPLCKTSFPLLKNLQKIFFAML